MSRIWDSLEVERVVKVFADDYIGEGITTTRNSELGSCGSENRLHSERESRERRPPHRRSSRNPESYWIGMALIPVFYLPEVIFVVDGLRSLTLTRLSVPALKN